VEYRRLVRLLKARRCELGFTQSDVCSCMGLTDNLINRWENFRRFPKGPMLIRWAWELGLHVIVGLPSLDYTPVTDKVLEHTIKKLEGRHTGAQKAPTRAEDAP
ncbi:hypothetical protein LCGC14_1185240, partial [marine sediment metagenome]